MGLWAADKLFFKPGGLAFSVESAPVGCIEMLICHERRVSNACRLYAPLCAEINYMSSDGTPTCVQMPGQPTMVNMLGMGAALVNLVFVAVADRIGAKHRQPFLNLSLILFAPWLASGQGGEPYRARDRASNSQPVRDLMQRQLDQLQPDHARPPHLHLRRHAPLWLQDRLVLSPATPMLPLARRCDQSSIGRIPRTSIPTSTRAGSVTPT